MTGKPTISLPEGRSRETRIRRDACGRWFNDGSAITHPKLVSALNRWVQVAEDGRYCLKNDINWAYVQIEGAPIHVQAVHDSIMTLSNDTREPLKPTTLRMDAHGRLYCQVAHGTMTAQFENHALVQLADHIEATDHGYQFRGPEGATPIPLQDQPIVTAP